MTTNVKFLPWIGTNYSHGISGKKTLILGESHYCANPETEAILQLTQNIIEDLFNPNSPFEPYKNTYTKFERALAGYKVPQRDKRKIWNDVMFYNYVQEAITGSRTEPTGSQFGQSEAAFFEVLNQYKPDKVIAWGQRLYKNLPQKGEQQSDLVTYLGESLEVWGYKLNNGQITEILACTHPSAGFSWDYWHKVFQLFINR